VSSAPHGRGHAAIPKQTLAPLGRLARFDIPSCPRYHSPGGRMYLYHAQGDEHGLEDQVPAATLAHWLRWHAGDA